MGEYYVEFNDRVGDDYLLEENYLEKKKSGKTKQAYAELFHDEKTQWMGWEKNLIQQMTANTFNAPENSEMGEAL